MTMLDILAQCQAEGIRLMMRNGELRRSPRASPELVALLRENREALLAIVGSRSWPWGTDPAFDQATARCNCGKRPHIFSQYGQALCRTCSRWTDDMDDLAPVDNVAR